MKLYSRDQMLKKYPNKDFSSEEFWLVTSDGQSIGTNDHCKITLYKIF